MPKTKHPRAIMCIWCGKNVVLETKIITAKEAIQIMKSHDVTCPQHPLFKENRVLRNTIKKIIQGTCLN